MSRSDPPPSKHLMTLKDKREEVVTLRNPFLWVKSLEHATGARLLVLIFFGLHLIKGFTFGGGGGGLIGSGMEYFFRDRHVEGAVLQTYQSVAMMPWAIKVILSP